MIHLKFNRPARPQILSLIFQGGFVGTACSVHVSFYSLREEGIVEGKWKLLTTLYPEDENCRQEFELPEKENEYVAEMKLSFNESSDFFGRVTIYGLFLRGSWADMSIKPSEAND